MARILDELPDPMVAVDAATLVLWANASAEAFLGYARGELVGRQGLDLIDPRDVETAAAALLRTLDSGGAKEPWPLRVVGRDGVSRWVEMAPSNLLGDPDIGAVLISVRSLEGRHAVEAEARAIEELFRRAFDDAPIGMALVGVDGRITRANNALCAVLQRPMLDLLGVHARTLSHPDDIEVERPLAEALLAGERKSYDLDKRFLLPDGSTVWVCVGVSLVRSDDGTPERFVVHVQDISHRKASEADLAHRATHDALTGLANRALLVDHLGVALARSERLTTSVAVLFCDVDGFKRVNDRLGHEAGDLVLAEVAARLEGAVRPGDTVARFGGDEFVVLCEDLVSDRDLDAIAARMVRAVGRPIHVAGEVVTVGLSIGHALSSGTETAIDLLKLADSAMYAAKAGQGS
jgi:diguanylate cyclase (GGDEF)-like protein/PAS domain S-box-containing protein